MVGITDGYLSLILFLFVFFSLVPLIMGTTRCFLSDFGIQMWARLNSSAGQIWPTDRQLTITGVRICSVSKGGCTLDSYCKHKHAELFFDDVL